MVNNCILKLVCLYSLLLLVGGSKAQGTRSWYSLPWQGSNTIYEQTRTEMRKEVVNQGDKKRWASGFRVAADKKPNDAVAQFKYAYSLYITNSTDLTDKRSIRQALDAMLKVNPPYTREYCRLMFMIEFYHFKSQNLVSVGRRLVKEMPDDMDIAWQLAVLLSQSPDLATRREALSLTSKVVKAKPKDAGLRFTHAMRAYWVYFKSKTKDDARIALSAFQDYLKIAPNDKLQKTYRDSAKSYIMELEYVLKH